MANILTAIENMRFRHSIANVRRAAADAGGAHAENADVVVALAALHVSQRRLIELLRDLIALHEREGRTLLDIAASADSGSPTLARKVAELRRMVTVLSSVPPDELPDDLRTLVTYGKAALSEPNCSVATLAAAVELAAEHQAQRDAK